MKPCRMLTWALPLVLFVGAIGGVGGSFSDGGTEVSSLPVPAAAPAPGPKLPPCPFRTNNPRALLSATGEIPPASSVKHAAEKVTYEVRPGDSLWSIAEVHLGEGERWLQVWNMNLELLNGEGLLSDPDLIRPGWTLRLPTEATVSPEEASSVAISPAIEPLPRVPEVAPSPPRAQPCSEGWLVRPPLVY